LSWLSEIPKQRFLAGKLIYQWPFRHEEVIAGWNLEKTEARQDAVEIREQLTHLTNQVSFKHIFSAVWDPPPLYRKKVDLQHQTNLENLKMVKSVS
jgi:hypothetical protein